MRYAGNIHDVITININGWDVKYRNKFTPNYFYIYTVTHVKTGLQLYISEGLGDCTGTDFLALLNKINNI